MNALKLFRLLLRLYPRGFRERFGREVEQTFKADLRQASRQGQVLKFWVWTLVDMGSSLLWENLGGSPMVRLAIVAGWTIFASAFINAWAIMRQPPIIFFPALTIFHVLSAINLLAFPLLILGIYVLSSKTIVDRLAMACWIVLSSFGALTLIHSLLVVLAYRYKLDSSWSQLTHSIERFIGVGQPWAMGFLVASALAFAWSHFRLGNRLLTLGLMLFGLLNVAMVLYFGRLGQDIRWIWALGDIGLGLMIGLVTLGLMRSHITTPPVPRGLV